MTIAFFAAVQESCSIKPELSIGVDRVFSSIPEYLTFPTGDRIFGRGSGILTHKTRTLDWSKERIFLQVRIHGFPDSNLLLPSHLRLFHEVYCFKDISHPADRADRTLQASLLPCRIALEAKRSHP
ncbi:hypothetical protein H6F74_27390 [Trichocoleus sp. FACHB-90]|uniref:hypothetical protein n=1 Tax=Cyanophyceae TaxID=3028117 RepID=UPI00168A35AF|nr:hypothetical protein [Trichocoleus sp. FACHB-90]MBD1929927.1 hypothetical protein [Trichocoleus sp. FACHB-90]